MCDLICRKDILLQQGCVRSKAQLCCVTDGVDIGRFPSSVGRLLYSSNHFVSGIEGRVKCYQLYRSKPFQPSKAILVAHQLHQGLRQFPQHQPPFPSSPQSQAQVQFQIPVGHQIAQSQQSAAFSNQAGHFTRNNHNTLFSQFPSISLLKRFVKHLKTWDKGTIIAVVAIVVSTIISYFALKLAIWTATKDYIEYCQGEDPIQETSVQCRKAAAQGLPPPPFYQYTGTVLRRTWTGIIIGATESKTQNDYYIWGYALIASAMFNVARTFRSSKRLESLRASGLPGQNDMEQQLQQLDGHITDPNVAWTFESSKPLESSFLRDSNLLVPIDMEQQPQQLGSHTTDPWPMNLAGEDRFSAVPEGNLSFRSGTASGTNQDKAPRKPRQRWGQKRIDRLQEHQIDLMPPEQQRKRRLMLPIKRREQDTRIEQLGPENSVLPENEK